MRGLAQLQPNPALAFACWQQVLQHHQQWLDWSCLAGCLAALQVKSLHKAVPQAFLDCHLCTVQPQNYLDDLAAAGGWGGVGWAGLGCDGMQ